MGRQRRQRLRMARREKDLGSEVGKDTKGQARIAKETCLRLWHLAKAIPVFP